jgi:lipopolysaccharide biosynthesis glycosyltransferase
MTVLGVLFQGNIEELYNTDLEGNAAAAVEDCSQRFAIYFDFAQLAEIQAREGPDRPAWLPPEHFDPEACVFNRGVLVVNSKRWMEENITRAIIWWMDEFQKSERNLYKYRWLLFSLLLQWSLLDVC